MTPSDLKAVLEIYKAYEKRKSLKKVKLSVLFNDNARVEKWYQLRNIVRKK